MESIKEIYRIGRGPSSGHTMGPDRAAKLYRAKHPKVKSFKVTLYGSLALTGKGHLTDVATKVMKETGKDIPSLYRETALGGLAIFGDENFVDN